ncbi:MAG: hypothetical protein HY017_17185 [Betaproteobacteria bacterium]|nr:hypothetical protein [Betaproteobacteria bacterium]
MNLSGAELRKLMVPSILALALFASGGGLIWWVKGALTQSAAQLAAARTERNQSRERLARISDEEREVKEKIEIYRRLAAAGIFGEERRLEWADAITRIRTGRELLDLRYQISPRKPIASLPGKPASVDFFASAMRVELALLHEGDLFGFLADLRDARNQYTSVQHCAIARTGIASTVPSLAPRLRAQCEINLITIIDRAAKAS